MEEFSYSRGGEGPLDAAPSPPASLNRFLPAANIGVEVKDKDGLVLNTFASLSDCAKYFGVSRSTVTRRLRKSEPLFGENGKLIYICSGR